MTVAFSASLVGLLVAFVLARSRSGFLSAAINQISFLPLLVPGIAFGAAYVALLGAPIGPLPALYGTFPTAGHRRHSLSGALCRADRTRGDPAGIGRPR